jgi:hypothetical protein
MVVQSFTPLFFGMSKIDERISQTIIAKLLRSVLDILPEIYFRKIIKSLRRIKKKPQTFFCEFKMYCHRNNLSLKKISSRRAF